MSVLESKSEFQLQSSIYTLYLVAACRSEMETSRPAIVCGFPKATRFAAIVHTKLHDIEVWGSGRQANVQVFHQKFAGDSLALFSQQPSGLDDHCSQIKTSSFGTPCKLMTLFCDGSCSSAPSRTHRTPRIQLWVSTSLRHPCRRLRHQLENVYTAVFVFNASSACSHALNGMKHQNHLEQRLKAMSSKTECENLVSPPFAGLIRWKSVERRTRKM